jgi:hypothetical protein
VIVGSWRLYVPGRSARPPKKTLKLKKNDGKMIKQQLQKPSLANY